MKELVLGWFLLLLIVSCCEGQTRRNFTIEGHRGARGYVPENTIPSFKKALDQGADTLELDLVVSGDGQLVVSHEPWFASTISLDKNGQRVPPERQRENNIFKMAYAEVKLFDVGSIGNEGFPMQEKMKVFKPLLKDVFSEISKYVKAKGFAEPRYNLEIKTEGPKGDGVFHPAPREYAKLVHDEIKKARKQKQVIVQSFDVRPLQELRKIDQKMPIALLVGNKDGVETNLSKLGFDPDTYSPHYSLVGEEMVRLLRSRNIKIVPWTVNEIADLERMKTFDLDGIITDYPDRAVKVFRSK